MRQRARPYATMRLALSLVRARRDLAHKVPPSGQSLEFFNVAREQHASNPALLPILLVHLGHLIHNALANILLHLPLFTTWKLRIRKPLVRRGLLVDLHIRLNQSALPASIRLLPKEALDEFLIALP